MFPYIIYGLSGISAVFPVNLGTDFIKFILFWEFIYFFLLLNYQIIATEKILKFVLKNLFWSCAVGRVGFFTCN